MHGQARCQDHGSSGGAASVWRWLQGSVLDQPCRCGMGSGKTYAYTANVFGAWITMRGNPVSISIASVAIEIETGLPRIVIHAPNTFAV